MSAPRVVLRERARQDVEDAVGYYLREAGLGTALGFVDEVERAFGRIAAAPAAGSTRYASELDLPGLRFRQLRRFPYLVFYVELEGRIDVWRVLHGHRDIPSWMQEPAGG